MSCNECSKTDAIPTCAATLVIGTVALLNTAMYVYVKDVTTGRLHMQPSTSSGAGVVSLDMTLPDQTFWIPDHHYELWMTTATSTGMDNRTDFVISSTTVDCINLVFERVLDENSDGKEYASITATLNA